ncbi:metal-dependent hydrolase [Pendulispora brunnea]|uniref:Metal-dependent hydrolase n=1 Tax=Pendulispora brunnea TaxID=2905690 RepID=A0ABZ2KLH7_9BACT
MADEAYDGRKAGMNLRFDFSEDDVPRHWLGGRKSVTNFFDGLSIFFPLGERFFIKAVRAHHHLIKDDRLRKEVRAFCGQEGIHSREHEGYNDMLERQGYPARALEKRVEQLLDRVSARAPKRAQLAITCALEHFTALMAHAALDNGIFDEGHPTMAALWKWHAVEENEHKSVAFDVYLAAGGDYRERAVVMLFATAIFWAKVFEHQVAFMRRDGILYSPAEWARLGWHLFGKPGWLRQIIPLYFQYYRPSFHPRDLDCNSAIARWKREFESSPAYRKAA